MRVHTRAVADSTHLACVIADMPFGSYQQSNEQAFRNCAPVRGISVMAHAGLMPQFVNVWAASRPGASPSKPVS